MKEPHFQESVLDINFYRDWVAKRKAALEKKKDTRTFFVTISREFGCEGYGLAEKVTKKISEQASSPWSLFTHKMIDEMVAGVEEETVEMVRDVSEKRWSSKDWFIDALVPKYLQSHSSHVFEGMKNVILNLADKGNCVILGAGSQIITHRLDPKKFQGIHIRVVASRSWRVKRLMRLFDITMDKAENMLRAKQDARAQFIKDFTGMEAADPSLYNIIFNNVQNSHDQMASIIVELLKLNGWED